MIAGALDLVADRVVRCVVFDLDGTLVDTAPTLAWAATTALAEAGLPGLDRSSAQRFIGHGLDHFIAGVIGEIANGSMDRPASEAVQRRFHTLMRADPCHGAAPRSGAVDLLERLDALGVPVGVCTNKDAASAAAVLRGIDIADLVHVLVGGGTVAERKPSAQPLVHCLARLGHAPDTGLFVGDSAIDVATASAAGCPVVVVRGGYESGPVDQLGADAIVDELDDLLDLISGEPSVSRAARR